MGVGTGAGEGIGKSSTSGFGCVGVAAGEGIGATAIGARPATGAGSIGTICADSGEVKLSAESPSSGNGAKRISVMLR